MAEEDKRQPAPHDPETPRKAWEGSGPGGYSWKAIGLAALGIYALLLIIMNSNRVSVDFVFFSQKTRVIYLVVLSMALGALIMWLVPRMRHRSKDERSKTSRSRSSSSAKAPSHPKDTEPPG